MLEEIEFKADRFEKREDCNVIEFTENTIILCNNADLKHSLALEILNTVNGDAEYNDYWCDNEDVGKAKYLIDFGLQTIIDINGQKITLGIEPSLIYKADKPEDIWFFDENGYDKESLWPMLIFKGSRDMWNSGKDEVYKTICSGCYGCYDGKWVNITKPDTELEISLREDE